MSYKIRNTIVLGVLWLILTASGLFWWAFWQPRQIKKINKDIQTINKELEDLPGLTDEVQRLTAQYQDVKRRYDSRSKEIPQFDISSQTYGYMSRGIDEAGFLKFDMKFLGSHEKAGWGYNAYKLDQGEAQFDNLFKFVYFLENGRRLYKISTMRMDQREALDADTKEVAKSIGFEMEIHAYFVRNVPELSTSLAAKTLTMIPSPFDPFKSIISQTVAPNAPAGEIDADRIAVKAVLPGKAFILSEAGLTVLHLGDKVWHGTVTKVSPSESSVEFIVDEGGIARTIVKKIKFEKR